MSPWPPASGVVCLFVVDSGFRRQYLAGRCQPLTVYSSFPRCFNALEPYLGHQKVPLKLLWKEPRLTRFKGISSRSVA